MRLRYLPIVVLPMLGPVAAADRTYSFECDTPEGHFSSWDATTDASALVVTGTLRLKEMRTGKRWSTVMHVFLRGGADGKTTWGFRAYDVDRLNQSLHLELLKPGGHEDFGNDSLKAGKKAVPFRLELSATGTLKVNVGGAEQSTEIGAFKPAKVDLGCSSGDFLFADIRIEETPR